MTARPRPNLLDRYTDIGALSEKVRLAVKRIIAPLAVALAIESLYLAYSGRPGAGAFSLIATGSCVALIVWSRGAIGLPLLPMTIIQNLVIYGVPIAVGHQIISTYPPNFVFSAGSEVLIFDIAMALAWRAGMQAMRPSPPVSHALHEFNRAGA